MPRRRKSTKGLRGHLKPWAPAGTRTGTLPSNEYGQGNRLERPVRRRRPDAVVIDITPVPGQRFIFVLRGETMCLPHTLPTLVRTKSSSLLLIDSTSVYTPNLSMGSSVSIELFHQSQRHDLSRRQNPTFLTSLRAPFPVNDKLIV